MGSQEERFNWYSGTRDWCHGWYLWRVRFEVLSTNQELQRNSALLALLETISVNTDVERSMAGRKSPANVIECDCLSIDTWVGECGLQKDINQDCSVILSVQSVKIKHNINTKSCTTPERLQNRVTVKEFSCLPHRYAQTGRWCAFWRIQRWSRCWSLLRKSILASQTNVEIETF